MPGFAAFRTRLNGLGGSPYRDMAGQELARTWAPDRRPLIDCSHCLADILSQYLKIYCR
jgi:hypothetical protein